MTRLQEIEVPNFKEPRLGTHNKNGVHSVIMGKGTVGLGKRYATPLEQAAKDEEMSQYLGSLERRLAEERAVKSRIRAVSMHQGAADHRRDARIQLDKKKVLDFQRMDQMRLENKLASQEEQRQRKQQNDLRDRVLRETKRALKAGSEAAKEEQRREFEHQRLERLERQATERQEHYEQRKQSHSLLLDKVQRIRLDARASRQHAVEAVNELKQKQRDESKRNRNIRYKKLEERNNEMTQTLEFDVAFAAKLRNQHRQTMSKVERDRLVSVYNAREESKREYETVEDINKTADVYRQQIQDHCDKAREHRRARSAMEKMYNS